MKPLEKMNIVVLDGYSLNPGDLSWKKIEVLGNCKIYVRTPPNKIIPRSRYADILLTNKTVLDSSILSRLPRLKYICVLATGYDVVDTVFAGQKNVPVSNIPTYSTESVSQMVFALILELTNHVGDHSRRVLNGEWSACKDFCFWNHPLVELDGQTLGIVGYGKIAKSVIKKALSFGMRPLVFTRTVPNQKNTSVHFCTLEELLQKSDIISLHCPLNDQTEKIIAEKQLKLMKKTAFLINTGRGRLLDEKALARALNQDKIAGAAVDVLSQEPPEKTNPLLTAKNCFITPHIAWATVAARKRLLGIAADNIKGFLSCQKINIVNSDLLP